MNRELLVATTLASTLAASSAMAAGDPTSDAWREASIATAYTLNEHLNPCTNDVEVNGATARLQGTVESDVDRDLAEQIAIGTEGIESVENNIVVEPSSSDGASEPTFARMVTDATVAARVKSQLLWYQTTAGLDVDVSTDDRVVTLAGTVDSPSAKAFVQEVARNTEGVRSVNSQLMVSDSEDAGERVQAAAAEAGQAVTDAWITTKVKSALLFRRNVDGMNIDVDTQGGVVTLSGKVQDVRADSFTLNYGDGMVTCPPRSRPGSGRPPRRPRPASASPVAAAPARRFRAVPRGPPAGGRTGPRAGTASRRDSARRGPRSARRPRR